MPLHKQDRRGSIWRRWDLHFHTPSSFDYRRKSVTNEELVNALRENGVSVVAITDHHLIDPERILELKRLAGNDITILPGIELRSELGGTTTVHYIGIFPEDIDVQELWTNMQGKLNLTPARVATVGDDHVWIPYDQGTKVIRELGGLVSIHAGDRSNSLEAIKNKPVFKQRIKTDILTNHVDLLEISSPDDCMGYSTIVFPSIGFKRPLVAGSDNHDITDYVLKCPCWIRGDATFAALKHVCCEPDDRVFIGELPPLEQRVSKNRTRYIRSVEVRKVPGTALSEKWFDFEVPLNHGMVAIIGNKGSGKSALADVIGLLGDTHAGSAFSFLTQDKFCRATNNKAKSFQGTICWESGGTHQHLLSEPVTAEIESVKYLPQAYIEEVCNELQEHGSGRFSRELTSVIFSHVADSERLGCTTFDDLLKYKTAEKHKAIDVRRDELHVAIEALVQSEGLLSPAYIKSLKEKIEGKQREIAAHDLTKPDEVTKPVEDAATQAETEKAEQKLKELAEKIQAYDAQLSTAKSALATANRRMAAADRLATRLTSFEAELKQLKDQSIKDCADLGLDFNSLVKVSINATPLSEARQAASLDAAAQTKALDPDAETGATALRAKCEEQMAAIRGALAVPAQKYQKYLVQMKQWKEQRARLEGNPETEGTLKCFEQQLADVTERVKTIPALLGNVVTLALDVYDDIVGLAAVFSELYKPVQTFIEKHPLARTQFQMSFETKIVEVDFANAFLAKIAQNRRGSFNGSIEGRERIESLIRETDFTSRDKVKEFLLKVWGALHHDLRGDGSTTMHVPDQLAKGTNSQQLYEIIFGLGYLTPFFTLRWAGKDVQQLSPGERGTLLLVFYLLIDRSDIPLIIDQPEENLDNQTVFNILVPSIKEARARRQLIIVTHNPNLAVVCDADQIIYASIDKEDGNSVTYESGAIENSAINRRILDVLEGTRPAFDNRDSKYHPLISIA